MKKLETIFVNEVLRDEFNYAILNSYKLSNPADTSGAIYFRSDDGKWYTKDGYELNTTNDYLAAALEAQYQKDFHNIHFNNRK